MDITTEINKIKVVLCALWEDKPHPEAQKVIEEWMNKSRELGIQEERERERIVRIVLEQRNNELFVDKTKRSVVCESILNKMGINIDNLPDGELTDKQIDSFINEEFKGGGKNENKR